MTKSLKEMAQQASTEMTEMTDYCWQATITISYTDITNNHRTAKTELYVILHIIKSKETNWIKVLKEAVVFQLFETESPISKMSLKRIHEM